MNINGNRCWMAMEPVEIPDITSFVRDALRNDAQAKEGAIREAMAYYDCGIEALRMECYPDGRWRIKHITPEEFWLDWISDNHGWGTDRNHV